MGKRSDFKRVERDCYDTPPEAIVPLLPHLPKQTAFVDSCAGDGSMALYLERVGNHIPLATYDAAPRSDLVFEQDMLALTKEDMFTADCVITNPPWDRKLLHALLRHLRYLDMPAWLLLDANWMFTLQAAPFLPYCAKIVTVGRVRWIPGTTMTGKDDCAWFYFLPAPPVLTEFIGRQLRDVSRETATA